MSKEVESSEVRRICETLSSIVPAGAVLELRIPNSGKGTVSGYFDNLEFAAKAAAAWSGNAPAVYFTINPVNPILLARAPNRLHEYCRHTTSDVDVVERCWFPIDIDAVRPAGISSTNEEHNEALGRAQAIRQSLTEMG